MMLIGFSFILSVTGILDLCYNNMRSNLRQLPGREEGVCIMRYGDVATVHLINIVVRVCGRVEVGERWRSTITVC